LLRECSYPCSWILCAYYKAKRNTITFPDVSLILKIVHNEKKKAIEGLQKFTEEDNEDYCLDSDEIKRISENEAYEITKRTMNGKQIIKRWRGGFKAP
jgi:hypothetical protein